jgi:hypothetical protein
MSRKSGALIYPEPLGPPWPVVGDLLCPFIKMNKFPGTFGFLSSATGWSRFLLDMDSSCEYGK